MADVSPEVRERLIALRERIQSGEMTDDERRAAGDLIRQLREQESGGIIMESSAEPPPTSVADITGGFVNRPGFEAAGGTAGAVLAGGVSAPTGPGALAAGVGGGALGAAGGSAAFDALNALLREAGVLSTPSDMPAGDLDQFLQVMGRAGQAGLSDAAFSAGGQVALAAGGQLMKPLVGRVLGLRAPEAQALIRTAQEQGIDISASTAAQGAAGRAARGVLNVLGVFPWVSRPVRAGLQRQFEQVEQRVGVLLDNLAPNATLSSQLGLDMTAAAKGAREEFVNVAGQLYDNVRMLSAAAGDPKIIPTDEIRRVAGELTERRTAGVIQTRAGEEIASPAGDPLGDFLAKLADAEDFVSVAQFRQLSDDLAETVNTLRAEGFDVSRVAQIREAMELALNSMDETLVAGGDVIKEALDRANAFYSDGIVRFQTPTAQRFGRIDRNVFGPGREVPGTVNADQAADVITNLRSPQAIRDMRSLIGDDVVNDAARTFLAEAVEASRFPDSGFLDFAALKDQLGITGAKRINQEALREFIGPETLSDLLKVGEVTENLLKIPNVNQFVARRAILGGLGSGVRAVTGAAIVGGSAAGAGAMFGDAGIITHLAGLYLVRRFTNLLANPAQLRNLTRAITDPDMALAQRRAILGRTMEIFGDQMLIEPTGSLDVDGTAATLDSLLGMEGVRFAVDFSNPAELTAAVQAATAPNLNPVLPPPSQEALSQPAAP